jgi:glycosyltransferase involved in cell wall biosynthesis
VVLYVGRLAHEKGIDTLVAACRELRRRKSEVELWIVGQGNALPSGLGDLHVRLVGPVPHAELGSYFQAGDVLAVPSRREPYGLVVREALQFGLPVVGTTAVPALQELCNRGWNIVPVDDVNGLAEAIQHAIDGGRWAPLPPLDVTPVYLDELQQLKVGFVR